MFGGTNRNKALIYSDFWELQGSTRQERISEDCNTCNNFNQLLAQGLFTDVTFAVEDERIPAHRCVLFAKSKYFRNMFASDMREKHQNEIRLSGITPRVFRIVLAYIYTASIEWDVRDWSMTLQVLVASDMYGLGGLRSVCEKNVELMVSTDNVSTVCRMAHEYGIDNLKSFCISYIIRNFRNVLEHESWQQLLQSDPGGLAMQILRNLVDARPYGVLGI